MASRHRKWNYYRVGSVVSGLRILDVVEQTTCQDTTMYRASYTCCDEIKVISHLLISRRVARGLTACNACIRSSERFFRPGDPVAGMIILSRDKTQSGERKLMTKYRVHNLCCGTNSTVRHGDIVDRKERGIKQCPACCSDSDAEHGNLAHRSLPDYGLAHYPDWPPFSFSESGANIVWEDRMGQ